MLQIKKQAIEELYSLYKERYEFLGEHLDYAFKDEERSMRAFNDSKRVEEKIAEKESEIAKNTGIVVSNLARRIMDAVFPRSIAKCVKCLEICDVEVIA